MKDGWTGWIKQENGSSWNYLYKDGRVVEKMGHYCPYIPKGFKVADVHIPRSKDGRDLDGGNNDL